jgi:hypothetical protein
MRRFVEFFSLIILVKKTFWTSLTNDDVIVKILNKFERQFFLISDYKKSIIISQMVM